MAELFDVSVVTFPAYPTTTVAPADDHRRRAIDTRRRMLESDMAGGVSYGRSIRPPANMAAWCRSRPLRRGRQVAASA